MSPKHFDQFSTVYLSVFLRFMVAFKDLCFFLFSHSADVSSHMKNENTIKLAQY